MESKGIAFKQFFPCLLQCPPVLLSAPKNTKEVKVNITLHEKSVIVSSDNDTPVEDDDDTFSLIKSAAEKK